MRVAFLIILTIINVVLLNIFGGNIYWKKNCSKA